jgi:hypothetical protein
MRRKLPLSVVAFLAVPVLLASGPALADFCAGKDNGWWCDGNTLVVCQNGSVASSQGCPCGCHVMPPGQPDQCQACGDFCSGKANGWWCDGDALVTCQAGEATSSTPCPNGCLSMPEGTPDKCADPVEPPPTGFCAGKADGTWCDGSSLVQCQGGQMLVSQPCPNGCLSMPDNLPDICKGEAGGFCQGKADGAWCNGDLLVHCAGGGQSSSVACPNGCQSMPEGTDDLCQPGASTPSGTLLTVSNNGGCGVFAGNVDLWTSTGFPVFNQKDYPNDTLGTCEGLTIKSSGCLISSLAMLYEFLGVQRSVGDQSGNSPPLEDAWRSELIQGHTQGYAAAYDDGGDYLGECNAYWNANPSGVALQYHFNGASGCVSYDSAVIIAESLNSGMPVIAGVHWLPGFQDQHWVLITGADSEGVRFNDPWGGAAGIRLPNGKLGSYTVDTFFTPYLVGGLGGGDDEAGLFDEEGQPVEDERSISRLPTIQDEEEASTGGLVVEEDESGQAGDGCGLTSGPPSIAFSLLFLLLAASLLVARRRLARKTDSVNLRA